MLRKIATALAMTFVLTGFTPGDARVSSASRITGYLLRASVEYGHRVSPQNTDVAGADLPADSNENTPDSSTTTTTTTPPVSSTTTIPATSTTVKPATTTTQPPASVPTPEPEVDPASLPWTLEIPTLGVRAKVEGGDNSNAVVDRGHIWHWTGTGSPDTFSHIVLFAHRTSHGGTFRDIHHLSEGDRMTLTGPTGSTWEYEVTGQKVVSPDAAAIYGYAYEAGGSSISLVACSKADGQPTSLRYRLVVNAVQI